MLEEISEHFKMWEVLSEGNDRVELIEDDVAYGRDSLGMRFQVHAPLSDVNLGSVHEPMRVAAVNEIKHTIRTCGRLEISMVTVHPGFVNGIAFLDRTRSFDMMRRSLEEISSLSEETGVVVALENLPANVNGMCTTASELLEAVEGTSLGMCFDMGHANTAGQIDEFLGLAGKFVNVHLHNNEGEWDQHNVVNEGTADLQKVVLALKDAYKGEIIIEATDLESGVLSKAVLERLLG